MYFKRCATSCLDKSLITKSVGNLTNKKMVHLSLLDYRLSDQAFRNRCANRMHRESERHVKLNVKLSFLSTLSLRVFLEEIFVLLTSSVVSVLLYYQIYAIMGLVLNLDVIC